MELPINELVSREYVVTEDVTAKSVGSGTVPVLSTPSMILFMEETASQWTSSHLDEGMTSVGVKMCVDHLKAILPGGRVVCSAVLTEQNGRKLTFEVEVKDEVGETVGRGVHVRVIVDEKKFMSRL